jgi:hypothetical protein
LDTNGLKADLQSRLQAALDEEEFNLDNDENAGETYAENAEEGEGEVGDEDEEEGEEEVEGDAEEQAEEAEESAETQENVSKTIPTAAVDATSAPAAGSLKEKLLQRAERFGIAPSAISLGQVDAEKLKQRAERFGLPEKKTNENKKNGGVAQNQSVSTVDPEVLQKRMERFGAVNKQAKQEEAQKKRLEEDEKKKQRQQRFELHLSPEELEEQKEK